MNKKLSAKIRIHLFTEDKCFGPGICTLLEEVEKSGSLRKAALNMDMSYSKAWKIVKKCEENLGFQLLNSTTGGKNGGGARITPEAAHFVSAYREYCAKIEAFADSLLEKMF